MAEDLIANRSDLLKLFVADAFPHKRLLPVVVNREQHAGIPAPSLYHDRGVTPFIVDLKERRMQATFCAPIILAETEGWDEQPFIAYLVYWTFRLKVRLTIQQDVEDEVMLEEMVESEMVRCGVPRWWLPRLKVE